MTLESLPYWGQLLVVLVVCLALGFVFFQFMYSPEVTAVKRLENSLDELRTEIRKYKPYENRKEDLEKEIQQIKLDLEQIEKVFPSVKDDIQVKRFVETVAKEFDINISSYVADAVRDDENFKEYSIKLKTGGKTFNFLKFYDALVKRDQVIHIYGMSLTSAGKKDATTSRYPVDADFTISSYVYIPVEETKEGGE